MTDRSLIKDRIETFMYQIQILLVMRLVGFSVIVVVCFRKMSSALKAASMTLPLCEQ